MNKLLKLFAHIRFFNRFAVPKFISEDSNYYYFRINKNYVTEISKNYLKKLNSIQLIFEAKYILNNQ